MSRCFVHLKKTRTDIIILHTYYVFFNDALRRVRYIASRHAIRQYLIAEHTYLISMLKHIYYVTLRSQCVRLLCYIMHALISQTALYDILLQHTMTSCPQAVAGHLPSYLDIPNGSLRLTTTARPLSRLQLPLDLGSGDNHYVPLDLALRIDASLARPESIVNVVGKL